MKDIVMITEDQEAVAQYSSLNSGVYVISVQVRDTSVHYYSHHVRLISVALDTETFCCSGSNTLDLK